jgi:hypothetical protein
MACGWLALRRQLIWCGASEAASGFCWRGRRRLRRSLEWRLLSCLCATSWQGGKLVTGVAGRRRGRGGRSSLACCQRISLPLRRNACGGQAFRRWRMFGGTFIGERHVSWT